MNTLQNKARQSLAVSALGNDRPETIRRLTRAIADTGCNILECRMTLLGNQTAVLVLTDGPWDAVARLEQTLPKLERDLELAFLSRRTETRLPHQNRVPYAVDAVCLDQAGIIHHLIDFFVSGDVTVAELFTRTYTAMHTSASMLSVQMTVSIPADMHIGVLREHFTEFCDRFNLDAVLEPVKS